MGISHESEMQVDDSILDASDAAGAFSRVVYGIDFCFRESRDVCLVRAEPVALWYSAMVFVMPQVPAV